MTPKEFAIRCVERELGNIEANLEMAKMASRNYTLEGSCLGKTCQQLLDMYRERITLAQQALEWVKGK